MSSSLNVAQETTLRRDLAAAYRLAARFGWDDTLYTHVKATLNNYRQNSIGRG
jgi:ribulose-5-phosphate 4-epimerase/fuculose-1-phosphate aldolase